AASPVPRCTCCSTNSTLNAGGAPSWTALVTPSAPCPTTTTTRWTGSSARASRTWSTMGRPHRRWRGLGWADRIRVPSPAANTRADKGRDPFDDLIGSPPRALHDGNWHRRPLLQATPAVSEGGGREVTGSVIAPA